MNSTSTHDQAVEEISRHLDRTLRIRDLDDHYRYSKKSVVLVGESSDGELTLPDRNLPVQRTITYLGPSSFRLRLRVTRDDENGFGEIVRQVRATTAGRWTLIATKSATVELRLKNRQLTIDQRSTNECIVEQRTTLPTCATESFLTWLAKC